MGDDQRVNSRQLGSLRHRFLHKFLIKVGRRIRVRDRAKEPPENENPKQAQHSSSLRSGAVLSNDLSGTRQTALRRPAVNVPANAAEHWGTDRQSGAPAPSPPA